MAHPHARSVLATPGRPAIFSGINFVGLCVWNMKRCKFGEGNPAPVEKTRHKARDRAYYFLLSTVAIFGRIISEAAPVRTSGLACIEQEFSFLNQLDLMLDHIFNDDLPAVVIQ